jgi:Ca-activated chloride channel family protein
VIRSVLVSSLLAIIAIAISWQAPEPAVAQEEPTFKVNVRLVNVFVTVLDQNGAPVGGLEKKDFTLYEDDVKEDIAVFDRQSELPLSMILAVDTSLSTRRDLKLELESARRFVHKIMRPIDSLALYQFDNAVTEVMPFTHDSRDFDRSLQKVQTGTSTSLYDAVLIASENLEPRHGRKVLILVTDGGDTTSTVDFKAALRAALQSEAMIYSIIVVPIESDAGRDIGGEHALIVLSQDSGGKYFYANSSADLDKVFQKIDEELRTQYLLAYYPKERSDWSEFRRIDVKVKVPGAPADAHAPQFSVRHRTGYYVVKSH